MYKEEKASLTQSNNQLLEQNKDLEAGKVEIRGLAVRLLDLASQSSHGAATDEVPYAVAPAPALVDVDVDGTPLSKVDGLIKNPKMYKGDL